MGGGLRKPKITVGLRRWAAGTVIIVNYAVFASPALWGIVFEHYCYATGQRGGFYYRKAILCATNPKNRRKIVLLGNKVTN
jgi:hypothetical protein